MFYDAVLVYDGKMLAPVFNGTTEEVIQWLKDNPLIAGNPKTQVCAGETMNCLTVAEYMAC